MTSINRETIAVDWESRGYSCDLWVDPPGQCWEDFIHATDELVIVMEGSLEFEVDGEVSRPEAGDEIYIPAGARHSVRNIGNSTARWLYGYKKT